VDLLLDRKAKESKCIVCAQDLQEFIFSSSSSTAIRHQAAKPKGCRATTPTLVAIKQANVVVKSLGRCAISETFWLQGAVTSRCRESPVVRWSTVLGCVKIPVEMEWGEDLDRIVFQLLL
jgi:hypothetical protein